MLSMFIIAFLPKEQASFNFIAVVIHSDSGVRENKIMASGPITSWQIEGEKVEAATDFIYWAPKSLWTVTAAMN